MHVKKLKEHHLNVNDIIELGWPSASGKNPHKVLELTQDLIHDIKVRNLVTDKIYTARSLGSKILSRID